MTQGSPSVLVVDGDPSLLMFLCDRLKRDRYATTWAARGIDGLRALDDHWPDLVILEMHLPDMPGVELARYIKARADIPMIVLSADDAVASKVDALATFAEDYVTKPFVYAELEMRIRRVLRRVESRPSSGRIILGDDLVLNLRRRRAIVAGRDVNLSPLEARFLAVLAGRRGAAMSTEELLTSVWLETDARDPAHVWVTVRRIRQKIEADSSRPTHLVSVAGGGYRLVAREPDGADLG